MLTRDTFGPHLRELRTRAGLTQAVAARHAGVAPGTWARWENGGMPYVTRAPQIARALGIPLAALLEQPNGRIPVADLTITAETLERIRKHGAPEIERVAAALAEQACTRIATLAAREPLQSKAPTVRRSRPAARSVRSRLAEHHRRRALREQ